jgi:hypothetical protein
MSILNTLFAEAQQLDAEVCPLSRREPTTEGRPSAVGNAGLLGRRYRVGVRGAPADIDVGTGSLVSAAEPNPSPCPLPSGERVNVAGAVMTSDPRRDLLRHALATLAYRGGKAVRGAPASFGITWPGSACGTGRGRLPSVASTRGVVGVGTPGP